MAPGAGVRWRGSSTGAPGAGLRMAFAKDLRGQGSRLSTGQEEPAEGSSVALMIFPAFLSRQLPDRNGARRGCIGASVVWGKFGRSGSDGALQDRSRLLEQGLCQRSGA